MDVKTHLKQITELHGPSGYENPVREALMQAWRPYVDTFEVGRLGSLVGIKYGSGDAPRRRIMIAAHMDEIGVVINGIEDGFLHISQLAGFDFRLMPGMSVMVHGKRLLRGVVGTYPKAALTSEDMKQYPQWDALFVDLGLPAAEVQKLVRIGDLVTTDANLIELQGSRVAGKVLDDRACVAIVTVMLDALQQRKHSWDVLATATTQEEMGLYGARTEGYRLNPDIAIALDVTFAAQPGVEGDSKLGNGPAVTLGPNIHPKLFDSIIQTAERIGINLNIIPSPGPTGTDAYAIQIAQNGVPTALLEVPIRNMHSPVETADLKDIEKAGRLLAEFISGLTPDYLASIAWEGSPSSEKNGAPDVSQADQQANHTANEAH